MFKSVDHNHIVPSNDISGEYTHTFNVDNDGQHAVTTTEPSYTFLTPSHTDFTQQPGMTESNIGPLLGRTLIQPTMAELPYRHDFDPIQPTANVCSHSQDEQSEPRTANMPTHKRRRSPEPDQEQWLGAVRQKLSKQSGVPEDRLGTMCFESVAAKRNRTKLEKKNKREVGSAGGACFLCLISKKKVLLYIMFGASLY